MAPQQLQCTNSSQCIYLLAGDNSGHGLQLRHTQKMFAGPVIFQIFFRNITYWQSLRGKFFLNSSNHPTKINEEPTEKFELFAIANYQEVPRYFPEWLAFSACGRLKATEKICIDSTETCLVLLRIFLPFGNWYGTCFEGGSFPTSRTTRRSSGENSYKRRPPINAGRFFNNTQPENVCTTLSFPTLLAAVIPGLLSKSQLRKLLESKYFSWSSSV